MAMSQRTVWAEMARRKVQFHPAEEWHTIKLWGLFMWDDVSPLLKSGLLLTHMRKENRTIWVRPSPEAWEKHIQPLIGAHSLNDLTALAGW